MKGNIPDALSSMITNRSRNELGVSLLKRKKASKIANHIKSLHSRQNFMNSITSRAERCDSDSGFCFRQALRRNFSNFRKSSAPSRFLFFRDGVWSDFPEEVFGSLRSGFVAGMPAMEVSVEGIPFLFDFYRMLQMDFETGRPRSIAWIDDKGKCFFPKYVVSEEIEAACEAAPFPKLEIEVKIHTGSSESSEESCQPKQNGSNFAKECTDESPGNGHDLPNRPFLGNPATEAKVPIFGSERPNWPSVEILKDGDKGYRAVKNLFLDGISRFSPDATVTSVCRCLHTSPLGSARLKAFQSQIEMTRAARGSANVRIAWHGTSARNVASTLMHGFGQPSRLSGLEAYGTGVYLSPQHSSCMSASLSEVDEDGKKHIILCRVIVGNAEKVEAGSLQSHPSSEDFDVGVDDLVNPRWYIVWSTHMNRYILPEYVVSFKSLSNLQGFFRPTNQLRGASGASSFSFGTLFSEMGKSLPAPRLQELQRVHAQYQARQISKEVLIRQVRSIAGDKLVVAAVNKIRGH